MSAQQHDCAAQSAVADEVRFLPQCCREQADSGGRIQIYGAAETAGDDETVDVSGVQALVFQQRQNTGADGGFGQLDLADIPLSDRDAAVTDGPFLILFDKLCDYSE